MSNTSTDVVPFEKYEIANADLPALLEAVQENLAGQELGINDLDRLKIPSGGGTAWAVPTLEGEEMAKSVQGVIIFHKLARAYWRQSLDETGGGQPPDCQSPDNVLGYGDPGDQLRAQGQGCADCPMSQFGTARDGEGRGQACKQMHMVFLLTAGEMLPMLIALPPTSLGAMKKYGTKLAGRGMAFSAVISEIGLSKVQGNGVPDYAQATFRALGKLEPADRERVAQIKGAFQPIFDAARVTEHDDGLGDGGDTGTPQERPKAPSGSPGSAQADADADGEEIPLA